VTLAGEKPERGNLIKEHPDLVERLHRLHVEWAVEVTPS
jgi:hypothetical protein